MSKKTRKTGVVEPKDPAATEGQKSTNKAYAVVKGFPLHCNGQGITFKPGLATPAKKCGWVQSQLDAGLLVEVDPLDFDPTVVQK